MKAIFYRVINSEFLTFNEVLRLKVAVVTFFLSIFTLLSIPLSSLNNYETLIDLLFPIGFGLLLVLTVLLLVVNFNRLAMHFSILTIMGLTAYYVSGSIYFYGYMLFFVTLTIIIFYQDILTYILYGLIVTGFGLYYITLYGVDVTGANSISVDISSLTYQVILGAFYFVFLIQFVVSDNIYERLNNEYVRMNKVLSKYQGFTHENLVDIVQNLKKEPIYKSVKFQQTVNELSTFINEFFEDDGDNIAEVVEFYFFLHEQDVEQIVDDQKIPGITRKYARQLKKYLLNEKSELVSILFDFSTLFKGDEKYDEKRYEYNLDSLFSNNIDKLLALSILYKFLKTEETQLDRYGKVSRRLSHSEIVELFVSKEFREFISYEQVNFFLDNQELFDQLL